MRLSILIPLAALAACGGEGEKGKAPARPHAIQAGQWQSSLEVTHFRQADTGRPRLNMPVGTRTAGAACVAAAETSRPPAGLFVGSDFSDCAWGDNYYMRSGRLNASATCQRAGVGQVDVTVNVSFTATSYEGTVDLVTRLPSDGDVIIASRVNGRRSGECAPAAEGGNQAQAH